MVHAGSMPYSAYGAYELKATYQRNMLIGACCSMLIGLVVGIILWMIGNTGDLIVIQPRSIPSDAVPTRPILPPTLEPTPAGPPKPPAAGVVGGIPNPVEGDSLEGIDTAVMVSPENYYYGQSFDSSGGQGLLIDTTLPESVPEPDSFIIYEVNPELVHQAPVEHPSIAKHAGMTGIATVQVLVDKDGKPLKAIIVRSSGWAVLDEAALAGAFRNVYKPGIQNARPVTCWISYRVDFSLEP